MLAAMTSERASTPAQMYTATRLRLTELFASLTPEELETIVPSTPAWTVLDVARHLAGVADDVRAGRVEGAASDPWTAAQVAARAGKGIDEVLAEWAATGPAMEDLLERAGEPADRLVIDVVTHEQDVRGALARPGGREEPAADWVLQRLVGGVDAAIRRAGVAPLRIGGGTDEWIVGGEGEPAATLSAPPYELWRALIGRRSLEQIGSYDWTGDAAPYVELLPVFPAPEIDIVE